MSRDRLFLDTVYLQALLSRRDQYHPQAVALAPRVRAADEVWTTEAIFVEVGNALSSLNRVAAAQLIERMYDASNVHIVSVDTTMMQQALALYRSRPDKRWGLTDCISFVVMQQHGVLAAATADEHFVQAGFRALMLEGS